MVTPVDADKLNQLLVETGYDSDETDFIVSGFKFGFDLKFNGNIDGVKRFAPNLKFRIGTPITLWNKIMKEVKLKRYAGPFSKPPFTNFIQSPVGLVPKMGVKIHD